MINFLPKTKTNNNNLSVKLVINTFTGNTNEHNQSMELLSILESYGIKPAEILDINQELIFEKDKSKTSKYLF
jgi:hypothetical protein